MDRGVVVADSDVILDAIAGEGAHDQVVSLVRAGRLATTVVTVFELWRGLRSEDEREVVRQALRGLRVFELNNAGARSAAWVYQQLKSNPIGERDVLIAGICLSVGRPLLTRNSRHFGRVPGLEIIEAR